MTISERSLLWRFRLDNAQAITAANQFDAAMRKQQKSMADVGKSAANTNRAIRNNGHASQQAAIQFSDFVVQVENGGNVFRAFGQQVNQVAAVMTGPWGIALQLASLGALLFGERLLGAAKSAQGLADPRPREEIERLAKAFDDADRKIRSTRLEIERLQQGWSTEEQNLEHNIAALSEEIVRLEERLAGASGRNLRSRQESLRIAEEQLAAEKAKLAALRAATGELDSVKQATEAAAKAADAAAERFTDAKDQVIGLGSALAAALTDAWNLAVAAENVKINATAAAKEWLKMYTYKQRFAGEEIVMGQAVLQPIGQGDPLPDPPKLSGGGSSSGSSGSSVADPLIKAAKEAEDAWQTFWDTQQNDIESSQVLMSDLASNGVSGFIDAIWDADQSFSEFAKNFLTTMGKMIAEQWVMNQLQVAFARFGNPTLVSGISTAVAPSVALPAGLVRPFAKGGVVDGPTYFPMRGGNRGLMGEAGPEAIMPLSRNSSGDLGVSGPSIEINNYTGQTVSVDRDAEVIRIAVGRAVAETEGRFVQSVVSGQGAYARSLEKGYIARRKL